ncbi:mycoredoxin [Pedococcus cremeus]|uniref:Mycoredoxin n=1 Tax=Pedococcus cremeus TaxID=587636 RepID=A0A1H9XGX6_9MICO|nr:glutaredoxin domain-containing protein [Pedococcus cremeus]SES45450.1 mycoredoxin [Pedococcus cremeus]
MAGPSPERRSSSGVVRRWWLSGWVAAVAVVPLLTSPPSSSDLVGSALLLLAAWVLSPRFFPTSPSDRDARRLAWETGVPVVYWRPGCSYCLRLRIALGRTGNRAIWVDVTRDPAASARVRAANSGDETVPTVFVGDSATTNPRPAWVRERLPRR